MANPILNLGNNEWATKSESLLSYSKSGSNFKPVPFTHSRASVGTTTDRNGVVETILGDTPRIDFQDNEKGALLLEPQRTNELRYTEDFTNAFWNKQGGSSVTSNTTTAPNGTLTADTLSGATGTDVSGDVLRLNVYYINVESTLSIYCKSLGSDNLTIYIRNGSNGSVASESISLSNEWQRIDLTSNPATGQIFFGNTNGDVAIWGAQMEAGDYPTSYIPTEASSVTRLKDECINGGNVDLFDISEGTLFVDANNFGTPLNGYFMITLSDGGSNFVRFLYESSRIRTSVYNGATQSDYFITGVNDNERNKVAITFKENEFKTYLNGVLKDTDTSGVVPTNFDRLNFASQSGTSRHFEGEVYQTLVFSEALSDSELQTLTTL